MVYRQPKVRLQSRDYAVLRDLAIFGEIALPYLITVHFEGRKPAGLKRLGRLRKAELVRRSGNGPRSSASPVRLTQAGHAALRARDSSVPKWAEVSRRQKTSVRTLQHSQGILATKAGFLTATRSTSISIETFTLDCPIRSSGIRRHLHPDAFFVLQQHRTASYFFVEVDRGTEPLATIREKAGRYRDWNRSGTFATTIQRRHAEPRSAPFRVLYVCESAQRAENMAASLLDLNPPVLTQAWFTTQDDLARDALGPIWLTPKGVRDAMDTATPPERVSLFPSCHENGQPRGLS